MVPHVSLHFPPVPRKGPMLAEVVLPILSAMQANSNLEGAPTAAIRLVLAGHIRFLTWAAGTFSSRKKQNKISHRV